MYFWQWLVWTTAGKLRTKLKESIFKTNNKINSTVSGQVQDWYLNEKMMLFHACLNEDLVLPGMEVIHRINKDERDQSLAPYSFLKRCCQVFLKYSKEVDYPRARQEFTISHQYLLCWQKTLLGTTWTQTYSEPFAISRMECSYINI